MTYQAQAYIVDICVERDKYILTIAIMDMSPDTKIGLCCISALCACKVPGSWDPHMKLACWKNTFSIIDFPIVLK